MAKVIDLIEYRMQKGLLPDGPKPFVPYSATHLRVLLKDGQYSEPVSGTSLYQWLDVHMDNLSPRVFMAISLREIKRREAQVKLR